MQQWEYLWLVFDKPGSPGIETNFSGIKYRGAEQCDQLLNDLGVRGWELVGVTTDSRGKLQLFFKRPRG